jgi:hypothetical protein
MRVQIAVRGNACRASGSALAFGRKRKRLREPGVRDIETIDGELRLLSRVWRLARELCDRMPSTAHIDELLDERCELTQRATTRQREFHKSRYE